MRHRFIHLAAYVREISTCTPSWMWHSFTLPLNKTRKYKEVWLYERCSKCELIKRIGKLGDSWDKPKYCLGVEHISVSDTVSDLGVIVDSHLSFSQHGTHGTINSFIHRKKNHLQGSSASQLNPPLFCLQSPNNVIYWLRLSSHMLALS